MIVYYTDGSSRKGSSSIGVYGISFRYHKPLGTIVAEVHAIEKCARRCLEKVTNLMGIL